jgi:hypothetical protein
MQAGMASSAPHHSMEKHLIAEVAFLDTEISGPVANDAISRQTLRTRSEVSLIRLGRPSLGRTRRISNRRNTWITVLRLGRTAILRLSRVGHRGLQEGLIITPGLDELLVKLRELIWNSVSTMLNHRDGLGYLSSGNICQSAR